MATYFKAMKRIGCVSSGWKMLGYLVTAAFTFKVGGEEGFYSVPLCQLIRAALFLLPEGEMPVD